MTRPGGMLVYSVCTITRAETTQVVEGFLSEMDDFHPAPFAVAGLDSDERGAVQLTPHEHGTDGMYIARFIREEKSAF